MEWRPVGDVLVVQCQGKIVAGKEVLSLHHFVGDSLAKYNDVVLEMDHVDFVDSSGLGALVRLVQAARAKGNVPVIAVDGRNDNKVLANGTLLTPNNAMDTTTGTISLKAVFGNDDDHLWPGQFVDARVQVGVLSKAVTVPVVAVQHGPDGLFVYVVKPDRTVDQVNIEVSYQDDGLAVVSKGLSENATVVTSGQSRLAPGTRVRVAPSPSPQASAGTQQPT